jgi:hypothetical protein
LKLPDHHLIIRERIRRDGFRAFLKYFWDVADDTPFRPNWHADAIADHLQAVHDYEILRLVICMPPRLGKSLISSVLFPAYIWACRASEHILNASYDLGLVCDFAEKSVDVVQSELFRKVFPSGASLTRKNYGKSDFYNDQGGRRISTIMGGRSTGLGSNIQLIDDPTKAAAANGDDPKALQNVISHIDGALSTRAVGDPEKFRRMLVMQRLHTKDPAGHCIKDLGWDALILPMQYSTTAMWDCMSSLKFIDPRSKDGELLFPSLWSETAVERLKKELSGQSGGSAQFVAAQLQQQPTVEGGSMVDAEWFGKVTQVPWRTEHNVHFFTVTDPGHKGTKTAHSRTAMGFYAIYLNRLYCLDRVARHMRYTEFKDEFKRLHNFYTKEERRKAEAEKVELPEDGLWSKATKLLVEDTVNGSSLLSDLGYSQDPNAPEKRDERNKFAGRLVAIDAPQVSKAERFRPETDLIRQGKFSLLEAPWNAEYIQEVVDFPGGDYDDIVDITAMSLKYFREYTKRGSWSTLLTNSQ